MSDGHIAEKPVYHVAPKEVSPCCLASYLAELLAPSAVHPLQLLPLPLLMLITVDLPALDAFW